MVYPSEKELLDEKIRNSVEISAFEEFLSSISLDLDDELILTRLRQVRNTFAGKNSMKKAGKIKLRFNS